MSTQTLIKDNSHSTNVHQQYTAKHGKKPGMIFTDSSQTDEGGECRM